MGQAKLKFTFLLPERPKSWNYRYSKHAYSVSTEGREKMKEKVLIAAKLKIRGPQKGHSRVLEGRSSVKT